MNKTHGELIRQVETLYSVEIQKVQKFERQHKDPVINLILECASGACLFLKQIQKHSFRPELEEIYSRLGGLTPHGYRLVLPLATRSGRFVFEKDGIPFVVMRFEVITPFSSEKISCNGLLSILSDFHEKVREFPIQAQPHRTGVGWLLRGPQQIRRRFGDQVPFIPALEIFLRDRLPLFRFRTGMIHWDVHQYNFGTDAGGRVLVLDFDLLQPGPLACDIMRVAPMYRNRGGNGIDIPEAVLSLIHGELEKVISVDQEGGFTRRDLKFMVGRCLMMEVLDWSNVEARLAEVTQFLQEIENWVISG
jgi:hypothetical protein